MRCGVSFYKNLCQVEEGGKVHDKNANQEKAATEKKE